MPAAPLITALLKTALVLRLLRRIRRDVHELEKGNGDDRKT